MTTSILTLSALLDKARQDEARCLNEVRLTEPNTPGHVKWHGHWQFHAGQRQLLELLLGNEDAARLPIHEEAAFQDDWQERLYSGQLTVTYD